MQNSKRQAPTPRTPAPVPVPAPAAPGVLDARLLGRPVHLLPAFGARLRDDLAELFRNGMNRRYRAQFQVGEVTIVRRPSPPAAPRWLQYDSAAGTIRVALDRGLLLANLHYRYGARGKVAPAPADVRETATEERLAARIGQQLAETLAARIDALPGSVEEPPVFTPAPAGTAPGPNAWTIGVRIQETALGLQGEFWLVLDDAWMSRLLRRIVPPRERAKEPTPAAGGPLGQRLQLTLIARLLDKEMPLGTLLDVRVGDVIPVSLGATEVLIDETRLFRAVVAEHAGKLCLTSFNDLDRS